jgi:hypothetical protein
MSLAPNRLGLFVNDPECGTYICGSPVSTALSVGAADIERTVLRDKPLFSHSILLVQQAQQSSPPATAPAGVAN